MEHETLPRGGRPWSFDRATALETAMTLFLRHGYEGVSISELTRTIGIAAPSLYAAFESKAGLYRAALDHYEASVGWLDIEPARSAQNLAEAVRVLLEAATDIAMRRDGERGCMVSVGLIACGPEHAALARDLTDRRERSRERVVEALSAFGTAEDIARLARYLVAVMHGISVQARDGATRVDLQHIIDEVVAGIEARSR